MTDETKFDDARAHVPRLDAPEREQNLPAGFAVERLELGLPFHFALRAHPAAQPTPDPSDRS